MAMGGALRGSAVTSVNLGGLVGPRLPRSRAGLLGIFTLVSDELTLGIIATLCNTTLTSHSSFYLLAHTAGYNMEIIEY